MVATPSAPSSYASNNTVFLAGNSLAHHTSPHKEFHVLGIGKLVNSFDTDLQVCQTPRCRFNLPLLRITVVIDIGTKIILRHRRHRVAWCQTLLDDAGELPHALGHCSVERNAKEKATF